MKGDFTRSTFRPQKHYTSVRMQQGRLQLDSDWNEQADIQNHLRRAQTVDMIGSGSGAASVDLNTGDRNVNSFKVVPISLHGANESEKTSADESQQSDVGEGQEASPYPVDLAILPGHFYANGILCELEQESDFSVSIKPGEKLQVTVSSLTVDGRPLEKGQWLEAGSSLKKTATKDTEQENQDNEIFSLKGWRIQEVDPKNRVVTLEGDIAALETLENSGQLTLRRVITYRTQPNYPNLQDEYESSHLLAYLDVWQRHITATDDTHIRENALNVPDTTTRTQTVWQLKLKKLPKDSEQLTDQTIEETWQTFLAEEEARSQRATMTACAKLCDNRKSVQLDNRLYRVEIHNPGSIVTPVSASTQATSPQTQSPETATFKWSRDNGSIVGKVIEIDKERSVIHIQQSNQAAWETTEIGQWLELITEEQEIKLEPGILVPFVSATGDRITFDSARITGKTSLPDNITKVRRWDHTTEQATIRLQPGLVPIENGIQVRFGPALSDEGTTSEATPIQYKTGDYWLIPARSGPQDIEWPSDQASNNPQPIPQPPAGISHAYGLLAIATADSQGHLTIEDPKAPTEKASQTEGVKRDRRVVFPPLLYAVDKRGVRGNLTISEDLTVGGTISANKLNIPGVFSAETFRSDTYEIVSDPLKADSPRQSLIQVNVENEAEPVIEFQAFENSNFTFKGGNVGVHKVPTQYALEVNGTLDASTVQQGGQQVALQSTLSQHLTNKNNPHQVTAAQIDRLTAEGNSTGEIVGQINKGAEARINANRIDTSIARKSDLTPASIDKDTDEIVKRINQGFRENGENVRIVDDRIDKAIARKSDLNSGNIVERINENISEEGGNVRIVEARIDTAIARKSDLTKEKILALIGADITDNSTDNSTGDSAEEDNSENIADVGTRSIANVQMSSENVQADATLPLTGGTLTGDLTMAADAQLKIAKAAQIGTLEALPSDIPEDLKLYVAGSIKATEKIHARSIEQDSSINLKKDFSALSLEDAVTILAQLNPVKFVYKADQGKNVHAGFISEETPDLLTSSDHKAVKILDIVAVVTKAVQHQQGVVEQLINVAKRQQAEIDDLTQQLSRFANAPPENDPTGEDSG